MVESCDSLAEVIPISVIAATVTPAHANLVRGISEHRTKAVVDRCFSGELLFDFFAACLCDIGPYAEHVGVEGQGETGGHACSLPSA